MSVRIVLILLLPVGLSAQLQSSAIFDNFSLGNRAHSGSAGYPSCPGTLATTDLLWSLTCGGVTGTYPWQTFSFSANKLIDDHAIAGHEQTVNITALGVGYGGYVRVTAPNNGFTGSSYGSVKLPVHVSGVNTCTGGPADCGANGYWFAQAVGGDVTAGMSGTNTVHLTSHPFANGERVWNLNCTSNPTMSNATFIVANSTANTFDLTGFSGTLCASNATVVSADRFDAAASSVFSGTMGSPSGSVSVVSAGWDVQTQLSPYGSTGYVFANNMLPGQVWDATFNRIRWDVNCNYDLAFGDGTTAGSIGANAYNFGVYLHAKTPALECCQGAHTYHLFAGNQYANHAMHFEAMRMPQHSTSFGAASLEVMENVTEWGLPSGATPFQYWDGTTEFYINYGPFSGPPYAPAGGICSVSNMVAASVTNETDTWTANVQGTYTGSLYELAWDAPPLTPATTFDIRYSTTNSLHAIGFATGTSGGSVTGPSNNGRNDTHWQSSAMGEAASLWVGIRPHMQVQSKTGAGVSPVIITPYSGHDLQTGNTITTVSVPNISDSTYTITRIDPITWTVLAGTLTNVVVSSGTGTALVTSSAGVHPGMVLYIVQSGVSGLDTDPASNRSIVTAVSNGTHFSFNTAAADGTYTFGGSGALVAISTFPAMSLTGTTGAGSAGATGAGVVTPADSTVGFYEMQFSATTVGVSSGGKLTMGGKATQQ